MTTDGAPRARERAPAKINLYLHVLGRRPDGFHDLDSLVAFAEVHDVVELTIADTFSLAIDGPFASALAATPHTDNLAFRAARASAADSGTAFRIRLTKNLPVAAGLGGGSADAAAVLRAAARLLDIPPLSLLPVARTLGADVPVCLHGRPMVMTGIGEILTPAPPLPAAPIVLACPPVAAPTSAVFARWLHNDHNDFTLPDTPLPSVPALAAALAPARNDLADAAAAVAPAAAECTALLAAQAGCLLARMSGSGPSSFALFTDDAAAEAAAAAVRAARPDWWAVATRLEGGDAV